MARSKKRHVHGVGKEPDRRRTAVIPSGSRRRFWAGTRTVSAWSFRSSCVDISMQGCRVKSRVRPAPKPGEPIWFQAPEANPEEWIEGVLVSTNKPFLRKSTSRIRFLKSLPYQTFKMLVYGPEGQDLERSERPEHEADHIWR